MLSKRFVRDKSRVISLSSDQKVLVRSDIDSHVRPSTSRFLLKYIAPLVIVAALVPSVSSVASASAKGAVTIVDCGKSSVRPSYIVLTCADANRYIASIKWMNWGTASAIGRGTLHWNDCSPTCVAGRWHTGVVTFTATTLRAQGPAHIYRRLHGRPSLWGESSPWWLLS